MTKVWRILFSIPLFLFLIALWVIGYHQIRQYGLIGSFVPTANYFGLSPTSVFIAFTIIYLIIAIPLCRYLIYPIAYHIAKRLGKIKEAK